MTAIEAGPLQPMSGANRPTLAPMRPWLRALIQRSSLKQLVAELQDDLPILDGLDAAA